MLDTVHDMTIDDAVHPTSLDWRLALQRQTKLGKECNGSCEVIDNNADVVHPPYRHVPSIGPTALGHPGHGM
jgi:hypothetical protein